MKKVYILALLSVGVGSIYADAADLTKITTAVQEGDLPGVKRLWRKINRNHEVDERREALDTLLDVAGDSTDESKETPSGGHNYKKLVPGGILYAAGLAGLFYTSYWASSQNWRIPRDELPLYYGLLIGSGISGLAGGYLARSGWNSEPEIGGRSTAVAIESFFDNALEELEEEDE